jgi:hypothetical protein
MYEVRFCSLSQKICRYGGWREWLLRLPSLVEKKRETSCIEMESASSPPSSRNWKTTQLWTVSSVLQNLDLEAHVCSALSQIHLPKTYSVSRFFCLVLH